MLLPGVDAEDDYDVIGICNSPHFTEHVMLREAILIFKSLALIVCNVLMLPSLAWVNLSSPGRSPSVPGARLLADEDT